jgi:anti-anti-sigma factor
LRTDFVAGLTVALVLIPQSMAYAQLAGLPAYYGLYAAFLPPIVAAMFGSSYQLATGPVAVVSLMTASALEPLATAGSQEFIAYAVVLALLVGVFQFALGLLKLGMILNLLSHPVVNGFTNAAAIIIATSQLSKIFGVNVDSCDHHYQTLICVFHCAMNYTHWPTVGLGALAFAIMLALKRVNPRIPYVLAAVVLTTLISYFTGFERKATARLDQLEPLDVRQSVEEFNATLDQIDQAMQERSTLSARIADLSRTQGRDSVEAMRLNYDLAVCELHQADLKEKVRGLRETLRAFLLHRIDQAGGPTRFVTKYPKRRAEGAGTWRLIVGNRRLDGAAIPLNGGGEVVGHVPAGLPRLSVPDFSFSVVLHLLLPAMVISLIGFMEAISIAKAMAARTSQHIDPNRELIGQGLANVVGSLAQSYPTSGSFSRSAVNLQAGAVTGLSNVFSSGVVVVILLFFTPWLYYLPQSVLAAVIMMAVLGLINFKSLVHHWRAQRTCGIIALISFVATLAFAPHLEWGILIGVILTVFSFLLEYMKPAIALLAKHPDGAYRNAERYGLELCRRLAVIRFNGSLFFASINYLEEAILDRVASMPHVKHILLVGNGINIIDASGEDMLAQLVHRLRDAGYDISMCGLNDPVADVLRRTGLYYRIGEDHFFRNVDTAVRALYEKSHKGSLETQCPLIHPVFKVPTLPA